MHSFEINNDFANKLREIKDERLIVHNSCASKLTQEFSENDIDFVISSLPLANIDKPFKLELMNSVRHLLKPEGRFIQYQYTTRDLRLLKKNFKSVDVSLCIKNIPSAFIYNCTNT